MMFDFRSSEVAVSSDKRLQFFSRDQTPSERSSASAPSPTMLLGKDLLIAVEGCPSLVASSSSSPTAVRKSLLPEEVNKRILEERKAELVGKVIIGTLSDRSVKGHFITWNTRNADTIFVSAKMIDECLTTGWKPQMKVTCTIRGIGPDYVQADRQHPFTRKVEYIKEEETPKESHFFNLASGARWNKASTNGWCAQGGIKSKKAMDRARMYDRQKRGRGGKPNSNFVFAHSIKNVESSEVNPMAIGRSDTVRSWRRN